MAEADYGPLRFTLWQIIVYAVEKDKGSSFA